MRDRTGRMQDDDYFYFRKLAIRGPDVGFAKETKGMTGQHSMGLSKWKNGAMKLEIAIDPLKEQSLVQQGTQTESEETPSQWECPYLYCPYDEQKYPEPWRVAQQREEEARKQQERERRNARDQEQKKPKGGK